MISAVIDLHAHILPALDDGPESLEGSAELARVAVAGGTKVLAATSHVNRSWNLGAADFEPARAAVVERLADEGIALEVIAGAEVAGGRYRDLGDAELHALALGGGDTVLLECPLWPGAGPIGPLVDDLHARGFRVLLAHPERSPQFQGDLGVLADLIERGAFAQLTASSLTGRFGRTAGRVALDMLDNELAQVLASDAHDTDGRPPDLTVALAPLRERYRDADARYEWMTETVPAALLAGEDVPTRGG
jgi:protein-tyrosine phosphatase